MHTAQNEDYAYFFVTLEVSMCIHTCRKLYTYLECQIYDYQYTLLYFVPNV